MDLEQILDTTKKVVIIINEVMEYDILERKCIPMNGRMRIKSSINDISVSVIEASAT